MYDIKTDLFTEYNSSIVYKLNYENLRKLCNKGTLSSIMYSVNIEELETEEVFSLKKCFL